MSVDTLPAKAFAAMAATPPASSGPRAAQTGPEQAAAVRPASADTVDVTDLADPEDVAGGDPRALTAARLVAAAALLLAAGLHLRGALTQGLAGGLLAQSHLVLMVALPAAVIGLLLLGRDSRVWLVAVTVAGLDLAAILASVYLPLPAVGPFPGLDEPVWLLTKAASALADLTVVVLWLIRQVAPPQD